MRMEQLAQMKASNHNTKSTVAILMLSLIPETTETPRENVLQVVQLHIRNKVNHRRHNSRRVYGG